MNITLDTNIDRIDDPAGTQEVVELIYTEVYGHRDDKQFRAEKSQEIYEWLTSGDAHDCTVAQLVAEWHEYDSQLPE